MGMVINNYSLSSLEKIGETITTKITNSNLRPYVAGDASDEDINAFDFRTMEKSNGNWILAYHWYDVARESMKMVVGLDRNEVVSSMRHRGDLEILVIDSANGNLLNEYKIEREITANKRDRIYNEGDYGNRERFQYTKSGRYEYWNHGIFSQYKNEKFSFIVNASTIKTDVKNGTLTYVNANTKSDKELLKSKPYLLTLDLENGFEYQPLLKSGTSLNGLMVDKMVQISESEFITNTPKTKEKRYVKITLD